MDNRALKAAVKEQISLIADEVKALALDIWEHPECSWKEERTVKLLREFLDRHGIPSEENYCGFPTSFRADVGDPAGPVFAFAAEYDAMAPGHVCGHNLIAAASTAAMIAATKVLQAEHLPGGLAIIGTPGEEAGSGKIQLLKHDGLRGVDAVMMAHPSSKTSPDCGSLAIRRYDITFHGVASHAAASPELGVNALDAMLTLFNGVNAFRQQMPEHCRIHGIITEGGVATNIIPDKAACRFLLRSATEEWIEKLSKRFLEIVQGASLIAGTTYTVEDRSTGCKSRKPNRYLNESYVEVMTELGEKVPANPPPGRGSSDFGNFSQTVPGAHPYFGIADRKIGAHSTEFREAAGSPRGLEAMLKAATALACTACRYLADEKFREAVQQDFRG